jgi:hypothetical protein
MLVDADVAKLSSMELIYQYGMRLSSKLLNAYVTHWTDEYSTMRRRFASLVRTDFCQLGTSATFSL